MQKTHRAARICAPAALALLLALPAGAQSTARVVGFVAGREGPVEILSGAAFEPLAVDRDVRLGDTVRTGRGGAVKIVLVDNSVLSFGEETELVLDELVVGPVALQEPSILRQLSGQIRLRVGEAFGGTTRIEVHTPTAVIGVKGTVFESRVREGETLVCGFEGEVLVQRDTRVGRTVPLSSDACTLVPVGEEPRDPTPPPPDFTPVGAGPSGDPTGILETALFGPGGVGGGDDPLGGPGDLTEWVTAGSPPDLPEGGPELPEAATPGGPTETPFEDPGDTGLKDDRFQALIEEMLPGDGDDGPQGPPVEPPPDPELPPLGPPVESPPSPEKPPGAP